MLQSNQLNQRQPQTSSQNRLPIPESIVRELQKQKQQLIRIKEQQQTIFSIDQTLRKKNNEIVRLRTLVQKYEPFYKKYQHLSYDYSQKCAKLHQKDKQITMLLKQVDELIKQHQIVSGKLLESDRQRSELLKQQREIQVTFSLSQKLNHQIQHTFKLYQQECNKKEMGLLRDLEKAYKQITQLNKRIDQYEMKVFENEELKKKLNQKIAKQTKAVQQAQKQPKPVNSVDLQENDQSSRHLDLLRKEKENLTHALHIKQQELTKYKMLNHQLSIEFDKSVSKICDFEKQLTKYRQENHELQKMLNLFVEKEKYEQMHVRQLERLKKNGNSSMNQESEQQKDGRQNQLAFGTNQQSSSEDIQQ